MPNIVINEISQNYTYNVGDNQFATVAIPITASWGPALTSGTIDASGITKSDTSADLMQKFEDVEWNKFSANQDGMQAFVSTYRTPASNFKSAKDYSFQMALTYLSAGYDVLVCRVASGLTAQATQEVPNATTLIFKAKYSGSFGNNLIVKFKSVPYYMEGSTQINYFNAIVYVKDPESSGLTAVENLVFVFDQTHESDNIPYFEDINSQFIVVTKADSGVYPPDTATISEVTLTLTGGTDCFAVSTSGTAISDTIGIGAPTSGGTYSETDRSSAVYFAAMRYSLSSVLSGDGAITFPAPSAESGGTPTLSGIKYVDTLFGMRSGTYSSGLSASDANIIRCNEFNYLAAFIAYTALVDKLNYSPQRVASPGWDDQNFNNLNYNTTEFDGRLTTVSPLHRKIMEVAYYGRCVCGMLDIPKSLPRKFVSNTAADSTGYAQLLSADRLSATVYADATGDLYPSHVALFAPWGKYRYVGTGKAYTAPPSFLAMLIQRAMIVNQPIQYEWALPTNRTHNLKIGELDYKTPKHVLDAWQAASGVGVNAITEIPGQGVTVWGNSTLFDVPPATYNALQNLSTRYLVNAVKDIIYRCGISITFQYNNQQAYNKFYAGVTPTLDTMKNVGAIEDYYVTMAADINGLDQVNANSVIGKVYLIVNGVINNITVDLIALPPGVDLTQFQ